MLAEQPRLATGGETRGTTRRESTSHFFDAIGHYIYGGDTALHMAAAAYRVDIIRMLLDAGAEVGAANRRGAQPLHYAADTALSRPNWDPHAQATPWKLASMTTGRVGSGSPQAKAQQEEIVRILERHGAAH